MIDTDWFVSRIAARKLSQRGLAKLMGLDPAALSLALRGKRKLTLEEAAQLSVLLDVSTTEVLERAGIQTHGENKVKVIGYLKPDNSVQLAGTGLHEMVEAPPNVPANCVAIQARTAGSSAESIDGWLYFVSADHGNPALSLGHFALLAIKGNGMKLAHVRKGYKRGTYNLLSKNSDEVLQNAELAWASPVLWIKTLIN